MHLKKSRKAMCMLTLQYHLITPLDSALQQKLKLHLERLAVSASMAYTNAIEGGTPGHPGGWPAKFLGWGLTP